MYSGPGALLPQHLDDRDQRAVAGGLGDPQDETADRRRAAAVAAPMLALHLVERLLHRRDLRLLRGLRRQRRALAFDHVAGAQQLERPAAARFAFAGGAGAARAWAST